MNLTGQRFGRLSVLYRHPKDYITPSTGKHTSRWVCQCDCGNVTVVNCSQLTGGRTQSCGCLQRERSAQAHTVHGGRYDRLHMIWANMKNRCYNPHYAEFDNYGGRGITVCKEWQEYPAFRDWALQAGYDSSNKRGTQTLDRIDFNDGYYPDNCRFVDMFTQANNKTDNIYIDYQGSTKTLSEWARLLNIPYDYLYYRVRTKGLPMQDVISEYMSL